MNNNTDASTLAYDLYNNKMRRRNAWVFRQILTEEQIRREEYEYIHLKAVLYTLEFIDNA
jgi:hypothetical protein